MEQPEEQTQEAEGAEWDDQDWYNDLEDKPFIGANMVAWKQVKRKGS